MANPYKQLLDITREEGAAYNPPMLDFGIVRCENPLQIIYHDLPLGTQDCHIKKDLLGYTENITITINGSTQNATITHESLLKEKTKVILYPIEDNQKYIVLGVI